ncbi:MAG: hypothetical protein ACTHN8_10275 [Angustibacter sp.]
MRDVRDLEVASVGGGADTTPDAVRAACGLLVPLVALMALRVWMVGFEWPAFVRSYGTAHRLDMSSSAGWVLAELRTPGQWGVVVDLAAALASVGFMVALVRRWWGARVLLLAAAAAGGIDVAGSLAYPVPWWFLVAGVLAAAIELGIVVLLCRPATSMHLQPEPMSLKEFAESC